MPILRNEDGFNSFAGSHPLAELDLANPLKWSTWIEDFNAYDITQLIGGNPWTLTATNCVDTITTPNGVLVLTLGGADNDAGQLQLAESPWALVAGKRFYFQARFKLTLASGGTVAANEMFVGLGTEQTTTNFMNAGGTALTVDNCFGFVKYDAGASMASVSRNTDVESGDAAVLTPADGVWATVAIYYDGSKLKFYAGTAADGSNLALVSTLSGNEPTGAVTPTLWIKGGEAKANVLSTDYIFIASER